MDQRGHNQISVCGTTWASRRCRAHSRSAISDHEVSVKRLFVSKQNGRARLCCLYCPSCEIKFGNPLKCGVELSQILICLIHGRSFWRGGAQPYAYLVGPCWGLFLGSTTLPMPCGERHGLWTKAKPSACNPASGFAVSDLPYSAADSWDLRQTKWVNSGPRKSADVRFGSKADI